MDPRGVGTIQVPVNNTAAQLLAKLCVELGQGGEPAEPAGVLSRALGLLDLAVAAKKQGRRLVMYDAASDHIQDVMF